MKIPLHKQITYHLIKHSNTWVHGAEVEKFGQSVGYEAYTTRRRAQELTQPGHRNHDPKIYKKQEKGCVMYMYSETFPMVVGTIYRATATTNYCCYSSYKFNFHDKQCPEFSKESKQLTLHL